MNVPETLAADLEQVIAAVPGVQQLYPATRSAALDTAAIAALSRVTGAELTTPPRVGITTDRVTVTISVDGNSPATTVAHAVHDTVVAHLQTEGYPTVQIAVKVARID